MPTPYGCQYKAVCDDEVTHETFMRYCQSETNQHIYCGKYGHLERDAKLPREWDEA